MKPIEPPGCDAFTRRAFVKSCMATAAVRAAAWSATRRIRVLSYNIHHGEGLDKRIDLPRVAAVITGVKPDVVMLQEVDRRTQRSGAIDQLAELSRLIRMRMYFGKTIGHEGGDYGNAILTRLPVEEHCNLTLPGAEPRGLVSVRTGSGLVFLGTHLDVGRNPEARAAAAERINRWIAARGDAPAILAGDFNDVRGSAPLAELAKEWIIAGKEMPTIPVANPRRQIDFILFRPASRWRVIDVKVLSEPLASDHLPIFAEFEVLP